MITLGLMMLVFAAVPTGLSIRARRYEQAALVLLACLAAPLITGAIAVGISAVVQEQMFAQAVMGVIAFAATALIFPILCASVLWKMGKFKAVPKLRYSDVERDA